MAEFYYILTGGRSQYIQENNVPGLGVLSKLPFQGGKFIDFKGVKVGLTKSPSDLNVVGPPFPQEVVVPDPLQHSGKSVFRLRFGTRPLFNTESRAEITTNIKPLRDSGLGIEPINNQGLFSRIGGWGRQPVGGFPIFQVQAPEDPKRAFGLPGFNNEQAIISSTLFSQRQLGLIK